MSGGPVWRGRAFAIPIVANQPIRGIADDDAGPTAAATEVIAAPHSLRVAASRPRDVLEEVRTAAGRLAFRVVAHDEGFDFHVTGFGRYRISPDGLRVVHRLPARRPWFWERFLLARALPAAAVLRGHEALHASAVALGDGAIAMLGDRGQGKTSIALHLMLGGAEPLTDDVLVLDPTDGVVNAHPGVAMISVRREEFRRLSREQRSQLAMPIGRGAKVYLQATHRPGHRPLRAVYQLARGAAASTTQIERVRRPDPIGLLASCFVGFVRSRDRLVRQLDVCSSLARLVPHFRVHIPSSATAADTAKVIRAHAQRLGLVA